MEAKDILGNMELVKFYKQKFVGMMAEGSSANTAKLFQTAWDTDVLMSASCGLGQMGQCQDHVPNSATFEYAVHTHNYLKRTTLTW